MKQFVAFFISVGCFFYVQAQTSFVTENFIADENNVFLKTFEGATADSASVYLKAEFEDGSTAYSNISDYGITHNIGIVFPKSNSAATITAIAFNQTGETETAILATIEPITTLQDALIGEAVTGYEKPSPENYVLLNTTAAIGAEKEAIILNPAGAIVWAETLPNSNENIDCNAINYQNGYVIITDCHTIIKKKLDGSDKQVYQFEVDSLAGANSFFHGKAIINSDGNIVSLFAHQTIVDRSLVGGNAQTALVSDGIIEFDFDSGEIVNIYSPMSENSLCQYFRELNKGGKYTAVFGDSIENYRLASAIVQDFNKSYFLTMDSGSYFPQGGISNVNIESNFCDIGFSFIGPNSDNFVFYEDDYFVNPRSFNVLPNGNYFMLSNYPDTSIVFNPNTSANDTIIATTGNGVNTRAQKFYLEFGYMGYFVMFWTVDDYNLPAAAYTEMGSAIWLPSDEMLGYSPTDKMLYQIKDSDEITGAMQFNENVSPVALVENFEITTPEVTIMNIDTLVCNDQMEMYQLKGMPAGGYFTGVPVVDGNIFDPTDLEAGQVYTITYNYGPYVASFDIEVDQCVSINELMQMGGLDSEILPNPVIAESAMLKYQLSQPGEVTLQIVNLNGQLLKNENIGFRRAGITAEMINVGNLPSGAYIYKLISENTISSKRFNIVK